MKITPKNTCDSCKDKKPTESWQEIGSSVLIENKKAGDTHHTFYQCQSCGSAFIKVEDMGGAGGKGKFYHSLTSRFY